jgi:hypothetical protein
MSVRVKKNFALLRAFETATPRTRRAIISTIPRHLILNLSEICANLLTGNIKLSPSELSRLRRYKNLLRTIASRNVSTDQKRSLLVQKSSGFFLPLFIPALTTIASLIGKHLVQKLKK